MNSYLNNINSTYFSAKGPISFAVLGLWDTKIGPCVSNLWFHSEANEKFQSLKEESYFIPSSDHIKPDKFLVSFILSTLLCGSDEPHKLDESQKISFSADNSSIGNSIKSRIIINEKNNLILHAFTYLAPAIQNETVSNNSSITDLLPFCLCFIFSLDLTREMNSWRPLIDNHIRQYLPYLRIVHRKCNRDQLITDYSSIINHLVRVLSRLHDHSVQNPMCMKKTFFCSNNMKFFDKTRREFLSNAIMSHLITSGRTLVIGTDISLINTMIRTLSVFLPPEKRSLCVELIDKDDFKFSSNLMVQGLCKDSLLDVDYTFWSVVIGPSPLTVIYLNIDRVLQTGTYTQHLWMQNIIHDNLLTKLYYSDPVPPLKLYFMELKFNLDCVLKDGSFIGDLCKCLVNKIVNVSGCKRKWEVLYQFWDGLVAKAKLLILVAQEFTSFKKSYNGYEWKVSRSLLKEATQLKKEGDFLIVLAVAEFLCPGIYGVVLECPMEKVADMENMFRHI